MSLRVYAYASCDTCRKAVRWLAQRGIAHELVPIREQPPSLPELRRMLDLLGGEVRRLCNTSGRDYRELKLGDRLPAMAVEDALGLLAGNGNLVKRPFALSADAGAAGFRPDEWERLFSPR